MTHLLQAQILQLIGNDTTEVSNDVINYVMNLLQIQCENNSELSVGYFSPAEIHLLMQEPTNQSGRQIPSHKKCIFIHPLEGHWVTSFYNKKDVFVYDSLQTNSHFCQIRKQIGKIHGEFYSLSFKYKHVQQQNYLPVCGVFARTFAVSLTLGMDPSDLQYD